MDSSFTVFAPKFSKVVFNSSTSWTVPYGVRSIYCELIGGGGGGGRADGFGGGGGGGGYTTKDVLAVVPGETLTINIGGGGAGAAGGSCNG